MLSFLVLLSCTVTDIPVLVSTVAGVVYKEQKLISHCSKAEVFSDRVSHVPLSAKSWLAPKTVAWSCVLGVRSSVFFSARKDGRVKSKINK